MHIIPRMMDGLCDVLLEFGGGASDGLQCLSTHPFGRRDECVADPRHRPVDQDRHGRSSATGKSFRDMDGEINTRYRRS